MVTSSKSSFNKIISICSVDWRYKFHHSEIRVKFSVMTPNRKFWLLLCCVGVMSTISFMYCSSSSSFHVLGDEILQRHARAVKPMIDMRGFPDTEGLCSYAGFFRNKTDCTQFYRCVDFNRNGKHTVFRFMCGPMTVFDQSRSLCTGPNMAIPPCPKDQLPDMNMTVNFTKPFTTTERITTDTHTTSNNTIILSTDSTTLSFTTESTTSNEISTYSTAPITTTSSIYTENHSIMMEATTTSSTSSETTSSTTMENIHPSCPTSTQSVATPNSSSNSIKEQWKPTASFEGILQIAGQMFLNSSSKNLKNLPIYPGTSSAIFVSGEMVTVTEERSTSVKQTTVSIPTGGILGIVTIANGGEISGISNGYFTTNSTRLIFPLGIRLNTIVIRDNGTMIFENPIDIDVRTIITVPIGSIFGQLMLSSEGVITGIGSASFSTHNLLTHYSTSDQATEILTAKFGVIYFKQQFSLSQSIVISSTKVLVSKQLETISAIIQITPLGNTKKQFNTTKSLSISSNSSFVIIPQQLSIQSQKVFLNEAGTVSSYTVLPGQMFGFFNVQNASVTNLGDSFFTTNTTSILFGSGTMYGIIKVGLDGSIIGMQLKKALDDLSVVVIEGSTVGKIHSIIKDGRQIINSIGGAPFVIRNLTSGDETKASGTIGLLGIDQYLSRLTTTSTELFTLNCKSDRPFQYPLDCSRFYQCVSDGDTRIVYVFSCLPGLYFDDASSECRTPAETICKDTSSINDTTIGSSEESGIGGIVRLDCNGNFYRYPLNCNNFFTCFKDDQGLDTINVFSCAAGLVFDDSSLSCLLPNETLPCDANQNFFKSSSIVFQLREKIDTSSFISKANTFFEQRTNFQKNGDELSVGKLPHQSGRGASQNKMGIRMSTNIEN